MHLITEPFRIRATEPIRFLSRAERREKLERASFNLLRLSSRDVAVDLLCDGADLRFALDRLSDILRADDSWAGTGPLARMEAAVRELTGLEHVVPTRLGRSPARILLSTLVRPGHVVPGNAHGEAVRAIVEWSGAETRALAPARFPDTAERSAFGGDIDLESLGRVVEGAEVPLVVLTLCPDALGGGAVSLSNLRAAADLSRSRGVPLFLDATRFAENAFLCRAADRDRTGASLHEFAREALASADGVFVDLERDRHSGLGGFIALLDGALAERCRAAARVSEGCAIAGGLPTSEYDSAAAAIRDGLDERVLAYRHRLSLHVFENLEALGVPLVGPPAPHAAFIDAEQFLPHLSRSQQRAHALACALYLEGGVRAVPVGAARPDSAAGVEKQRPLELVRLAIPTRSCTQSHVDHAVGALAALLRQRGEIRGLKLVRESSPPLAECAEFEPAA